MTTAIDMTPFIAARSDQLNADDLMGGPRTITITRVTASPEGSDQPVSVFFEGDNGKPFRPCKTARRVMVAVWGVDASTYVGRSMTIYRDPDVMFGGLKVGGIRISHMSHMKGGMVVAVMKSKGKKAPIEIKPLVAEVAQMPKAKQTAEQWASEHRAQADNAATLDALAEIMAKGAKPMAKLQADKPELWAEVNAAYAARRHHLEREGKPDADMGEGFADDEEFGE